MDLSPSIASTPHDHGRCIDAAMEQAGAICSASGARLTQLRKQVLLLIWQSHTPLGAYALIEQLAKQSSRRVAPPTVYRTLDFLLEQGLIHRINRLNAFVGCTQPDKAHANNFLICDHCGVAIEFSASAIQNKLQDLASNFDFQLQSQSIEVSGLCKACKETSN